MENFTDKIAGTGLTVVDFNAEWCGPCRKLKPIFAKLAQEHPDCRFISVNVDEEEDLSDQYRIKSLPTVILFREGKEIKRIVGFNPDALREAVLNNAY